PLRTKVGPETSLGGLRATRAAAGLGCGDGRSDCCLASAAAAAPKQRSRLAQRLAPEGCVGVAGASPNERQACARPSRSSQPPLTPSLTAQQSALSSLPPT